MLSDMDINAIAGTLKLYFRELPEPLLTDRLYPAFMEGIGEAPGPRACRPAESRAAQGPWLPCSSACSCTRVAGGGGGGGLLGPELALHPFSPASPLLSRGLPLSSSLDRDLLAWNPGCPRTPSCRGRSGAAPRAKERPG